MTKKVLGMDVDGVMYEWDRTARYMLREILPNSPYTKDGPLGQPSLHWDHIKDNVDPEHWRWLWTEGVQLGLFRHGHLYAGTIRAVREIVDAGWEITAITHRPKNAVVDTLDWLSYQRLPISGIHVLSGMEDKTTVAHCNAYIDDKIENCLDFLNKTDASLVAMPARAWNEHYESKIGSTYDGRFVRVPGWREFVDALKRIA